mmetsp:Transcript_2714/g.6559  ORF Transcript_2714/g.6559 Transcript_2714/m.6559 type:complete len:227 (+) Transcript_2714:486-1166(+)
MLNISKRVQDGRSSTVCFHIEMSSTIGGRVAVEYTDSGSGFTSGAHVITPSVDTSMVGRKWGRSSSPNRSVLVTPRREKHDTSTDQLPGKRACTATAPLSDSSSLDCASCTHCALVQLVGLKGSTPHGVTSDVAADCATTHDAVSAAASSCFDLVAAHSAERVGGAEAVHAGVLSIPARIPSALSPSATTVPLCKTYGASRAQNCFTFPDFMLKAILSFLRHTSPR